MTGYGNKVFHNFEYILIDKTLNERKKVHFNSLYFSPYDVAEKTDFAIEDIFNPFDAGGEV